jgi:hypothetical protein
MTKVLKRTNGRHPDAVLLDRLGEFYDRDIDLAKALDVTPQALNNWKRRGVAPGERGKVYKLAKKKRCAPPLGWLTG